jgi:predicted ester cyclase
MAADENRAFIRGYLDSINGKQKPAALVSRFVADSDEVLRQHIAQAEAAFPRYELVAEDTIAEGDKVVVRFTLRGNHQGEFMGIPPTGRQIAVPGTIIYRIAGDKIVEHWMQIDAPALMQQLGVAPG